MSKEIWKDIEGYGGVYQVSTFGRIKSLKFCKERILKVFLDGAGYISADLYKKGKIKMVMVHQIMAITFLNHKPHKGVNVVDHINNNRLDNLIDNLQIITHRENLSKDKQGFSSKYIGVGWHKRRCKWQSAISIKGKKKHLGYFLSEDDAHNAYQNKLKTL